MKRSRYIVLAGLLIAGIVCVYLYRQELGLGGPHTFGSSTGLSSDQAASSTVRPARMNWQAVNRPKDGFKLEMPADTREIQVPAYNENGGSETINMILANPDGATAFAVAWADNPPVVRVNNRAPDRTLDMARDGALTRTQTSLVSERRIAPGGFPARDFVARNVGGGVMDSRLLYAGNRLYMLIAVFPSMSARREQDVTRFFNSFTASGATGIPETLPLGSALGSGNLSTAQSAFATVQSDLKSTPSQAMANATAAVAQTMQWVDDLLNLSYASSSSSTLVDPATAILDSAYGLSSSSNITDPALALLESQYGAGTTGSASSSSAAGASSGTGSSSASSGSSIRAL